MTEYASLLAVSLDRTKVVLIHKKRPKAQKGKINIIGGHIELGEVPRHAAIRELREESSLRAKKKDVNLFCTLSDITNTFIVYFYVVFMDISTAKTTTGEVVEIFDIDNLPDNILYNLNWLIPMGIDASDNIGSVTCMA